MNTKALRQKVLDLAIHGKLVPQNQNDESATVLLEKIRAEKAEKIKKGELKADKKDSFIFVGSDKRHYEQFADGTVKDIEDEIPFDVPEKWAWIRQKNLGIAINGKAFKPSDWTKKGLPIVRIQNLNDKTAPYNYFDKDIDESFLLHGGELLFAWSGTPGTSFGAHIWDKGDAVLNQHIFKILFDEKTINKTFYKYCLNNQVEKLIEVAHGSAGLAHITKNMFDEVLIPLPPYNEQIRIVSEFEKTISLINCINDNKIELNNTIKQVKSKILDLAIHGKLVPQDPNDEPAEELLKRIATSDNRPYEKVESSEIDWTLPNNWCLCHFGDIATVINGKNQSKVENQNGKYPIYGSGGKMGRADDYICPENCTIIGRKGSINNPIFVEEKFWNVDTAFGLCPSKAILPKFLFYFCEYFDFTTLDSSTTLPSLTKTNIQQIIFALPPIGEQKRILDKTNELFRKLDEIVLNLI